VSTRAASLNSSPFAVIASTLSLWRRLVAALSLLFAVITSSEVGAGLADAREDWQQGGEEDWQHLADGEWQQQDWLQQD
jgi:hypothetical protein